MIFLAQQKKIEFINNPRGNRNVSIKLYFEHFRRQQTWINFPLGATYYTNSLQLVENDNWVSSKSGKINSLLLQEKMRHQSKMKQSIFQAYLVRN